MTVLDVEPRPIRSIAASRAPVVLLASRITRRFGATTAVNAFGLELRAGEIVALLGDNGAGKTTLFDIVGGRDAADAGEVRISRTGAADAFRTIKPGSRRRAIRAGIALVRRRPALAPELSGLDNVLVGAEGLWRPLLRRRAARAKLDELRRRLDLLVDLDTPVARLSAGDRLRIALLRALFRDPRVVLLDEPTAALTTQESARLYTALRTLAAAGIAVAFSTRSAHEALAAADRIVVVRGGTKVTDVAASGQDADALTAMMIGRTLERDAPEPAAAGEPVLALHKIFARGASERACLRGVSLDVRAGEIVGVAGSPGNGQDTLVALFTGLVAPTSGELRLYGRTPRRFDPALMMRFGIARIPADCRHEGIVADMSVIENFVLEDAHTAALSRHGLLNRGAVRQLGERMLAASGIAGVRGDDRASVLTDADMRRLVFTRMLDHGPNLILADHPTRDLDLIGRREVHLRLLAERRQGAGILLLSDDLDELLTLSDAIGVLYDGRLTVPQPTGAFDRQSLGFMMGGHGSLAQDWGGWGVT